MGIEIDFNQLSDLEQLNRLLVYKKIKESSENVVPIVSVSKEIADALLECNPIINTCMRCSCGQRLQTISELKTFVNPVCRDLKKNGKKSREALQRERRCILISGYHYL